MTHLMYNVLIFLQISINRYILQMWLKKRDFLTRRNYKYLKHCKLFTMSQFLKQEINHKHPSKIHPIFYRYSAGSVSTFPLQVAARIRSNKKFNHILSLKRVILTKVPYQTNCPKNILPLQIISWGFSNWNNSNNEPYQRKSYEKRGRFGCGEAPKDCFVLYFKKISQ